MNTIPKLILLVSTIACIWSVILLIRDIEKIKKVDAEVDMSYQMVPLPDSCKIIKNADSTYSVRYDVEGEGPHRIEKYLGPAFNLTTYPYEVRFLDSLYAAERRDAYRQQLWGMENIRTKY